VGRGSGRWDLTRGAFCTSAPGRRLETCVGALEWENRSRYSGEPREGHVGGKYGSLAQERTVKKMSWAIVVLQRQSRVPLLLLSVGLKDVGPIQSDSTSHVCCQIITCEHGKRAFFFKASSPTCLLRKASPREEECGVRQICASRSPIIDVPTRLDVVHVVRAAEWESQHGPGFYVRLITGVIIHYNH
jgi:hypothetical protein